MDAGKLLPDEDIVGLLQDQVEELPSDCRGILLDGFPRTLAQAQHLEKALPVSLALSVNLKDEHIIAKIAGRRICAACGKGYNFADVHDVVGDVIMPPLLP